VPQKIPGKISYIKGFLSDTYDVMFEFDKAGTWHGRLTCNKSLISANRYNAELEDGSKSKIIVTNSRKTASGFTQSEFTVWHEE